VHIYEQNNSSTSVVGARKSHVSFKSDRDYVKHCTAVVPLIQITGLLIDDDIVREFAASDQRFLLCSSSTQNVQFLNEFVQL